MGNKRLAYFGALSLTVVFLKPRELPPKLLRGKRCLIIEGPCRRLRTIRQPREWENLGAIYRLYMSMYLRWFGLLRLFVGKKGSDQRADLETQVTCRDNVAGSAQL